MKPFDFSQWDLSIVNSGLLFFAQSIEELLFHYGHDSLKVPALNFPLLCMEIRTTIKEIESGVIDSGNMRPLFEELHDSFNHDPIVKEIIGNDFESLFYIKNSDGEIEQKCTSVFKDPGSDNSIKSIQHVVEWLIDEMQIQNRYFELLKANIVATIKVDSFEFTQQDMLYKLCKILLTELINYNYSPEYIYWVTKDIFYNHEKPVNNIDIALDTFWSSFDFEEKNYTVILPLKKSYLQKHLKHFQNVTLKENSEELFGNSCKWIIEIDIKSMDHRYAHIYAVKLIRFFTSLLQYNNHKSSLYKECNAIVIDKKNNNHFNLQMPITPLRRGVVLTDDDINEKIVQMINAFSFQPEKFTSIIELHSSAIDSSEINNQLLNLWTIIEILVPIERQKGLAKINQICNIITSVLNAQYMLSLLVQLHTDLYNCIPDILKKELNELTKEENDINKVAALLALPENRQRFIIINDALKQYPLLQYRLNYYANICSTRNKIKDLLQAHRKRLSWHIMRIYRNRNMIVHDGNYFPYLDIIVQNLHYYIDTLINTISLYANKGYKSINSIYTALQQKEYQYISMLNKKNENKAPLEIIPDFPNVILGYLF